MNYNDQHENKYGPYIDHIISLQTGLETALFSYMEVFNTIALTSHDNVPLFVVFQWYIYIYIYINPITMIYIYQYIIEKLNKLSFGYYKFT